MRIAVPDFVSSTHIAVIAAKELGIFSDEGQEVDIVHIPAMQGLGLSTTNRANSRPNNAATPSSSRSKLSRLKRTNSTSEPSGRRLITLGSSFG